MVVPRCANWLPCGAALVFCIMVRIITEESGASQRWPLAQNSPLTNLPHLRGGTIPYGTMCVALFLAWVVLAFAVETVFDSDMAIAMTRDTQSILHQGEERKLGQEPGQEPGREPEEKKLEAMT